MNLQPNEFLKIRPMGDGKLIVFEIRGYLFNQGNCYGVQGSVPISHLKRGDKDTRREDLIMLQYQLDAMGEALDKLKLEKFGVRYKWTK